MEHKLFKKDPFLKKVSPLARDLSLRHGMFLVKWVCPGLFVLLHSLYFLFLVQSHITLNIIALE